MTILVNGLPLVHIELERRGVPIREAFNQINRYQRDSFWTGSGLFEYVQIFAISSGSHTKCKREAKKQAVLDKLQAFFEQYRSIGCKLAGIGQEDAVH